MTKGKYLFTSESVTEGHPDKVADGISDAILDAYLRGDKDSRVACETMVTTGLVMIAGEITSDTVINHSEEAREKIKDIGYDEAELGFSAESCSVLVSLDTQSPDISQGVTIGDGLYKEHGAGDQGMMFGYACNETEELMPMPIVFANRLTQVLTSFRKDEEHADAWLIRPDGKAQVTIVYEDGKPIAIDNVVVSTQHHPSIEHDKLYDIILNNVIKSVLPEELLTKDTKYLINPTGKFIIGGPHGDCGLTGRKIIVDTYGGMGRHGGGAFSGKDPSKVDRSAAYMARFVAKNLVVNKLAKKCLVSVAYAIGKAEPVMVEAVDEEGKNLSEVVRKNFNFKPQSIMKRLKLRNPIFSQTASYGHFGKEGLPWEEIIEIK